MKILHKPSDTLKTAIIELMENDDWEQVYRSDEFEFDWSKERKWTVYKLTLEGESVIQGLISIENIPKEYRTHIHLIENKIPNKGKNKVYDYVAGCLIAYVCDLAFKKRFEGFVSLKPKTEIIEYYETKYGFRRAGIMRVSTTENSEQLIQKYL